MTSLSVRRATSQSMTYTGETVASARGATRRQRHTLNRGASISTVPNKGLQSTRAPVLERPQNPTLHADPTVGRILRHLTAQHARLQPGQKRLALGKHEADLRERADHRRPAERHQLRRLHLARARPRLQPHRPPHQARPCGQASARPISPGQASHLPQVFDTPQGAGIISRSTRKVHERLATRLRKPAMAPCPATGAARATGIIAALVV